MVLCRPVGIAVEYSQRESYKVGEIIYTNVIFVLGNEFVLSLSGESETATNYGGDGWLVGGESNRINEMSMEFK